MENSGSTPLALTPEHFNIDYTEEAALPPEDPSLSPGDWLKKNLFSTPSSILLTVVFSLVAFFTLRGIVGFVFSEERQWNAVATNSREMAASGYPLDQFVRIWVALGSLVFLAGLSAAISGLVAAFR